MKTRKKSVVVILAAALTAGVSAQPAAQPSLDGLWAARVRYGPDVQGHLIILRRGDGLVADLAGFSVPVQVEGQRLSFSLPDGRGDFRGHRRGRDIGGFWVQPATAGIGRRFATPVTLSADGGERWRGEIVPLADRVTYFLPVTRSEDGRYATYLRNPERNFGRFFPVSRLVVEGETVRLMGTQRGGKRETLLATGRLDPQTGVLRIPVNLSTFDFVPDTRSTSPFFPRGRNGEPYAYAPPIALDDGWPVATLEQEGISREAIERFVQSLIDMPMETVGTSQIHSLLIARHGRLVLEEYFHGDDRDTPHDLRSASKSWTSVLIGAAMQAGVPIRLDTPVYQTMLGNVPADLDPRKRAMTLEHLVTMTAGFDCDDSGERPGDEDVMQDQTAEPDWYRYTLGVPMVRAPGEGIVYCSIEPNLAGGLLERVAGEPLPEMFERLIARPLQMGRYHLFLTPTGTAYGGGGHRFVPRDFLKLAQLMLNQGRWGGRQIVSREWAQRSTAPLRNLTPTQTYGFLWNSVAYPYRGRTVHAFFAAGNGGQIFMGIPELDLAIGFTGGNYSDAALFIPQRVMIPEQILPAVN